MKVTVPKNAKHIVLALKLIAQWTRKVNIKFNARTGMLIEGLTDKRCGYYRLAITSDDLIFGECTADEVNIVGIDLKLLLHCMRDITTLSDVIVFKISNDNVKVIVKTKKNELETLIRNEHVLNQLLDTAPHDMQYIFDGEIVTKDLDDALKKCSTKKIQLHIKDRVLSILQYQYPNDDSCSVLLTTQKNANNSNNEELPDDYKQHFILEDFSDMVKSTMAKKLRLRVAHSYPLDITYKIMKFSTIQIYLCECIP